MPNEAEVHLKTINTIVNMRYFLMQGKMFYKAHSISYQSVTARVDFATMKESMQTKVPAASRGLKPSEIEERFNESRSRRIVARMPDGTPRSSASKFASKMSI